MFVIFYTKANSEIVGFFNDMSSPAKSESEIATNFYSDNGVFPDTVGHAVVAQHVFSDFNAGKYLYDASTSSISENPNYVAPTPTPDPVIPAEPTV